MSRHHPRSTFFPYTTLFRSRLGTKVAAPAVTIVDDALIPAGLGSRPFDGEGLPTTRTVLVREGVLESYLLDTYSARKLGMASTHHATRDGSGVSVSTSNLDRKSTRLNSSH